jgi:hypothetical protein
VTLPDGSGGTGDDRCNNIKNQLTGCKPKGPEGLEDTEVNSGLFRGVNALEESLASGNRKEKPLNPVEGSFHERPLLNPEGQLR